MVHSDYRRAIEVVAKQYGIDPDFIEAIVMHESAGNADAFRFEPGFYTRYLQHNPRYAAENPRRVASSYGLMQIMLSTARDFGFNAEPEMLFVPGVNLEYGCRYLTHLLKLFKGNKHDALEAYNGGPGSVDGKGRDALYADNVIKLYVQVKAARSTSPNANA